MIRYEHVEVSVSPIAGSLPALIDSARNALDAARNSGEVLEALAINRVAYDAAKSAGRLAKAKQAHDTLLAEIYRAQADILMTEARGKMRLAEEYDAAQDRGEIKSKRGPIASGPEVIATAADIGLTHKDIHDARQIRDAELANPGVTERVLNEIVSRGEEPTKAKLNREILAKPKAVPQKVMDQSALWVWGRLKDFDRDGIMVEDPAFLISEMTDPMRDDVRRISPLVRAFLEKMEQLA